MIFQGVANKDKIFSIQSLEQSQLVLLNSIPQKQHIVAVATSTTLVMMVVAFVCLAHGYDLLHVKGNAAFLCVTPYTFAACGKSVRIATIMKFKLKKL